MINNPPDLASEKANSVIDDWRPIVDSYLRKSSDPLIVILGPTACGKTDLSLEIAEHIAGQKKKAEIINADSRQLYRFLDIGTAKIDKANRRDIPHHLLDVLDPNQEVTMTWYKKEAERTIAEIQSRHGIPMLVGGSMLYISAVIDGLESPVGSDPEIRKRLEEEYDKDGGILLHQRLTDIDAKEALGIPRQNKMYLVRALEIAELTGAMPSSVKIKKGTDYQPLLLGIDWPRPVLLDRIKERTRLMLQAGWIEEVQSLLDKGYGPEAPAMKSHGYREIVAALRSGALDRDMLVQAIEKKTRDYAKRQMTWWRGDKRIHWIKK